MKTSRAMACWDRMKWMTEDLRNEVSRTAQRLGLTPVPVDWSGIDVVLPLIERMRQDGAIVLIKFDGERRGTEDNGPYTFVVSGGALGDDHLRIDSISIESGLAHIISGYFERA